jgi:hypothetical protein
MSTAKKGLSTLGLAACALSIGLAPMAGGAPPHDRGDADGDGLVNHFEYTLGTDPERADTDWDSLRDGDEKFKYNTDPKKPDTDGDALSDRFELDTGTDPLVSGLPPKTIGKKPPEQRPDRDGDGLFDDDETDVYTTDPDNPDTDGDGTSDGKEVWLGTDPTD